MSDDFPAIERNLLRGLETASPQAADGSALSNAPADISSVLEAVHLTATTMSTMAERIEELEAHTEAFSASNTELATENRRLTIELGDAIQQRDSLAVSLAAEGERLKRLESDTAQQIARATTLERDLGTAHADLVKIVDAVGNHFALDASEGGEDSAAG